MLENPSDDTIRALLAHPRRFAVVGASPNPQRPSHGVATFLAAQGHHVTGINPGQAGARLFGQTVVATLAEVPPPVDVVDIFRRSEAVPAIVDTVLAEVPTAKVIWMQLGVIHPEAAAKARAAGLTVIQDRCPVIEHRRLF